MIYKARVTQTGDGTYVASAVGLPNCWSSGRSQEEALDKLKREIRYRIEYCPCSSVDEEFVRVEVELQSPRAGIARSEAPGPVDAVPGVPARPSPGWRRWDD